LIDWPHFAPFAAKLFALRQPSGVLRDYRPDLVRPGRSRECAESLRRDKERPGRSR